MQYFACLVSLSYFLRFTHATLDFYVDSREVERLVGFATEWWYVRDGVKMDYASDFSITIKSDVETLYFVWHNKNFTVGDFVATYTLEILYTPNDVVGRCNSSLGNYGDVPHKRPETFTVTLPCTGKADGEIDITIHLQILAKKNHTLYDFRLKRKKICVKKTGDVMVELPSAPVKLTKEDAYLSAVDNRLASEPFSPRLVAGTSAALVALALVAVGVCIVMRHSHKRLAGNLEDPAVTAPLDPGLLLVENAVEHDQLLYMGAESTGQSILGTYDYGVSQCESGLHPPTALSLPQVSSGHPLDDADITHLLPLLEDLSIDLSQVQLHDVLLSGTFSQIQLGVMADYDETGQPIHREVRIKSVRPGASTVQVNRMLLEGLMFTGIDHPNINAILACAYSPTDGLAMLVYDGAGHDNLRNLLLTGKWKQFLPLSELISLGLQALEGLDCLHQHQIIHKDVAARNCLVSRLAPELNLKLSDSALSRDLFPDDYHCLFDNTNKPIKWMAHESLTEGEYSTASDVWSFGVLMWELMSFNCPPFVDEDPMDMAQILSNGLRLGKPPDCPDFLHAQMMSCWRLEPGSRPTVDDLIRDISEFHANVQNYV